MIRKVIAKSLKIMPSTLASRAFGNLSQIALPRKMQKIVNVAFAKAAKIDISEASAPIEEYASLNAFFTRTLKRGARNFSTNPLDVSAPSDGKLTAFGKIEEGEILEIKNQEFNIHELLSCSDLANKFQNGYYFIIYLSPRNYHRIHTPFPGAVTHMTYSPGHLLPVNRIGLDNVDKLFPQNERLTSYVENAENNTHAAVVKVGATCVGKISVTYDAFTTNTSKIEPFTKELALNYELQAGDELGCFNLGSTVILFVEDKKFHINEDLKKNQKILAGQVLGSFQ